MVRSWHRLLGEFVVIVVGVLTALGVDQWAEARQQRAMEADYVARIEADLVADSVMLAVRRTQAEEGLVRLGELLAEIPEDGHIDLAPYRDAWYQYVGPAAPPVASTSAFDELISTGGLILIRSVALRTTLLEYQRWAELQSANLATAFQRGRDPFMELGWQADVVEGTQYSRPTALVETAPLTQAVRRAIAYQAILARNIGDWETQVRDVLALVRRS